MASINFVQNIYINVSGGIKVPAIQADISDYENMTYSDINDLYTYIANNMKGSLCACSLQINPPDPSLFGNIPSGENTYGDNTGFQVKFNRLSGQYDNWIGDFKLLYKGNEYGGVTRGQSTGDYKIGYLVLFTSNNVLLGPTGSYGANGSDVGYTISPGLANYDDKFINAVLEDGSLYLTSTPALYTAPLDDISDIIAPIITPTDPYQNLDDESGPGGGDPDRDTESDPIPIPDLPQISAVDTGFITLFNPSAVELKTLAAYMWSSGFDLSTLKKLFADPMDAILGLSIVPVDVPSGGSRTVTVGNISTGVSMTLAANQYVKVECGTLHPSEWWGAYLDYSPYTKCEIYLPYIGTHPLNIDDIMDKDVTVEYHVDILSGACFAFVQCGDAVLYSFVGQCAASIPISGNDWTNVINGVMQIGASIGTMIATGGASAPLSIPMLASTATNGMKPQVEKSGSVSGTGGLLGIQYPYLILTRPRLCIPADQNEHMGYPSFITRLLGDISGYTEIEIAYLDGLSATQEELNEIETLLKQGVIL